MNIQQLQSQIDSSFPLQIRYFPRLASTNTTATRLAKEGVSGWTVVVADEQTAGRGRHRRNWVSPAGLGLWFSIILRPTISAQKTNLINLSTAVIISNFLEQRVKEEFPDLCIDVKWPNDILIAGKKLCGILLESGIKGNNLEFVVIGIGMNVNQTVTQFSAHIKKFATSLQIATGKEWSLEDLLGEFLVYYFGEIENTLQNNFEGIISAYQSRMIYKNREIEIDFKNRKERGIVEGIDTSGYLKLKTDAGINIITAGDVWGIKKGKWS